MKRILYIAFIALLATSCQCHKQYAKAKAKAIANGCLDTSTHTHTDTISLPPVVQIDSVWKVVDYSHFFDIDTAKIIARCNEQNQLEVRLLRSALGQKITDVVQVNDSLLTIYNICRAKQDSIQLLTITIDSLRTVVVKKSKETKTIITAKEIHPWWRFPLAVIATIIALLVVLKIIQIFKKS